MIFLQTTSNNNLSINANTDVNRNDLDRILLFLDAHIDEGFHLDIQFAPNVKMESEVSTQLNNYLLQNQDKVSYEDHFPW